MTLSAKFPLLSALSQPRYVAHHQAPQSNGSPWGGSYGPSWMSGSSSGNNWRSLLSNGGGAPSGAQSTQSTAAPGAATGWIGAPSWSNSNAKWRDYYSNQENQGNVYTTYASPLAFGPKFSKSLNKAFGKQISRELKDMRKLVKHLT